MALSAPLDAKQMGTTGRLWEIAAKKDVVFYPGALIVVDPATNLAAPGTAATGLVAVGRCERALDTNGLNDGEVAVQVRDGIFRYPAKSADEPTVLFSVCYVSHDGEIAKTATGLSVAGVVAKVEDSFTWVSFNPLDRDVS